MRLGPGHPYGAAHQRRRRRVLGPGTRCAHCGELGASVLDHQPPLALHRHIEGSGCCVGVPSCADCSHAQAGALAWAYRRYPAAPSADEVEVEPVGFDAGDPCWDVDWLEELRDVPESATWPRLMSPPHPAAIGSYGAEAVAWLRAEVGLELRWWQRLELVRQFEHDATGALVWLEVLLSTARQSGKSTVLRAGATWRLHQADRFGEEQTLLHTGKDLPVCKEVQRLARAWAKSRGYPVREQNGNEQITEPVSGSRWIVRGRGSVYGYPSSAVLVDEAWGVAAEVVEDGLEPTMAERLSPQMLLASTAHRRATPLFPRRRGAVLTDLAGTTSALLMEWSAPKASALEDRGAWRLASPHWSRNRERLLEARLERVLAGESVDVEEDDPVESFRSQYLNIWSTPASAADGPGDLLLGAGAWERLHTRGIVGASELWVAVEDNYGAGGAVGAVAMLGADRYEIDGWLCASADAALADGEALVAAHPFPARLILGPSLPAGPTAERAGASDTRYGLPLLRAMVAAGRLAHDETPELDEQLRTVRVRKVAGGLAIVAGLRADAVRAVCWALRAAVVRQPEPAIG